MQAKLHGNDTLQLQSDYEFFCYMASQVSDAMLIYFHRTMANGVTMPTAVRQESK